MSRLPFLAGLRVRAMVDWHLVPCGPLAENLSVRVTEPDVPVATGTRKLNAKCVCGVPDPGLTVTLVVGPSPAAGAEAAQTAAARVAAVRTLRILPPLTTPDYRPLEPNGRRQMPRPWVAA